MEGQKLSIHTCMASILALSFCSSWTPHGQPALLEKGEEAVKNQNSTEEFSLLGVDFLVNQRLTATGMLTSHLISKYPPLRCQKVVST